MLSKKAIDDYKKIYKKEFGEEVSDEEALEQGTKLANLMRIIYKPITKEEYKRYSKPIKKSQDS